MKYDDPNLGGHTHTDKRGYLHQCYHTCKHWFSPGFVAGFLVAATLTFGPEHGLWEKIWPFYLFTNWLEALPVAPWWFSLIVLVGFFVMAVGGLVFYVNQNRVPYETPRREATWRKDPPQRGLQVNPNVQVIPVKSRPTGGGDIPPPTLMTSLDLNDLTEMRDKGIITEEAFQKLAREVFHKMEDQRLGR